VLEDEEQQKANNSKQQSNKISTFTVGKNGKKRPALNAIGSKPVVSKPAHPIVIDEVNPEHEVELERPQTAKSQATNAGNADFDDDDLFGGEFGGKFSKAKKYVG
jgi:hypothetical protein